MISCGHQCQPVRRGIPEWEAGFRGLRVPIGCGADWMLPRRKSTTASTTMPNNTGSARGGPERNATTTSKASGRTSTLRQEQQKNVLTGEATRRAWKSALEKTQGKVKFSKLK